MDPDTEIKFEYPNSFIVYKSGRIKRFPATTEVVPPSLDQTTGVLSKDVTIDARNNISARLYVRNIRKNNSKKKIPVLIYIHGGAFCLYSSATPAYHTFVNSLVSKTDVIVVSVNYRLATENLLPIAYEDAWVAIMWVFGFKPDIWLSKYGDIGQVFIAGDSAGGNIVHQMVLRAEQIKIKFEGMILIDPYFWGEKPIECESTDVIDREFMRELWEVVNIPGVGNDDERINPMAKNAPSLRHVACKRALICIASEDLLVERGRLYFNTLRECGWEGDVDLFESEGEGHDFHLDKPNSEHALELMDRLVSFLDYGRKGEGMNFVYDCWVGIFHVWNRQILPFLSWRSFMLYHTKRY